MSPTSFRNRVYCAGPLFNACERQEMTQIAEVLCTAGFDVYLPHRDGMEFRLVLDELVDLGWNRVQAAQFLHQAIFTLDVYQLVVECDSMAWNLNGRVPDEGAVSEAAIAWTLGKPIVGYKDDVRSLITGRDNPLLAGLIDFEMLEDITQIPTALRKALKEAGPLHQTARLPPSVEIAVNQGRQLWETLQAEATTGDSTRIAAVVAELFAPLPRVAIA